VREDTIIVDPEKSAFQSELVLRSSATSVVGENTNNGANFKIKNIMSYIVLMTDPQIKGILI